jgi:hypothetical protein
VERYHACNAAHVCPETGTRATIYEFATDRERLSVHGVQYLLTKHRVAASKVCPSLAQ